MRRQKGTAVAQWLRCCATYRKVTGSIPAGVSGFFINIESFRSRYGPGVDSASNRNEYQECFLGVKAVGAKADNLPPFCATVTKSGNLNFLELSGPVQACNATDLPLCVDKMGKQTDLMELLGIFCHYYPDGESPVQLLA